MQIYAALLWCLATEAGARALPWHTGRARAAEAVRRQSELLARLEHANREERFVLRELQRDLAVEPTDHTADSELEIKEDAKQLPPPVEASEALAKKGSSRQLPRPPWHQPAEVRGQEDDGNVTGSEPSIPYAWQTGAPSASVVLIPMVGFLVGIICLCMLIVDQNRSEEAAPTSRGRSAKADAIFRACDRDRDGFVSYGELLWLARLTNPSGAEHVTPAWFQDLCRPLGADPVRGLDRQEFRRTYQLIGADIDKDYEVVTGATSSSASGSASRPASSPEEPPASSSGEPAQLTPGVDSGA